MATISLSMIVKNGGEISAPVFDSVCSLMDQIVIADTGSTDNTVEIARRFGAVVVTCPWTDHYGDARNVALAPISTDWVLVLDADEELPIEARLTIPKLLECRESIGEYTVTFRRYFKDRITGMLVRCRGRMEIRTSERRAPCHTRSIATAASFVAIRRSSLLDGFTRASSPRFLLPGLSIVIPISTFFTLGILPRSRVLRRSRSITTR